MVFTFAYLGIIIFACNLHSADKEKLSSLYFIHFIIHLESHSLHT